MEKSRQHEMKLFKLMFSHRANTGYDHSLQGMASSHNLAYNETGFYPTWNGGFAPNQTNQPSMSEGSTYETLSHMTLGNTRHCKTSIELIICVRVCIVDHTSTLFVGEVKLFMYAIIIINIIVDFLDIKNKHCT